MATNRQTSRYAERQVDGWMDGCEQGEREQPSVTVNQKHILCVLVLNTSVTTFSFKYEFT